MTTLRWLILPLLLATPILTSSVLAQEAPRLIVQVHGNTGSPPMLGLSYALYDHVYVRFSGGYYRETWDETTSTEAVRGETYTTNWYGGELATVYRLPERWRLTPYAGLGAQYVYATEDRLDASQTADRLDLGSLVGLDVRVMGRIGLNAEVGMGYRQGLDRNSGGLAFSPLNTTAWGLTRVGVGLRVGL